MAAARKNASKGRQSSKRGPVTTVGAEQREFRGLLTRINPEGLKALRLLAVELDTTIQALGVEALNDLLQKHGRRAVIRNPLLD